MTAPLSSGEPAPQARSLVAEVRQLLADAHYRTGVRAMLPMAPGVAAWGLVTGVAMAQSISTVEALAMALLVFAGSAQLAVLPLLVAGAPAWVVLAAAFCVNLRFIVFSIHLRGFAIDLPLVRRLALGYFTTDMAYAILNRHHPQPAPDVPGRSAQRRFMAGVSSVNWSTWTSCSVVGVALAHAIPSRWGLGFIGALCLMGLLCTLVNTRLRAVAAAVAGLTATAAYALPLKLNIVVAIGCAVLAALLLESRQLPQPSLPRGRG